MILERNPNYWKTTTIDGVEYQLPFYDEVVLPIIPDQSTQVAALRTGKLDYMYPVDSTQWKNLESTAPELISSKFFRTQPKVIWMRCNEPPFDDVNVRRAMMIGTDIGAFGEVLEAGPIPLHYFPLWPGHSEALFTPLEKLPASAQLLYDYNPTLAKQMLADAGYPDGIKTEIIAEANRPLYLDLVALLKDQWAQIGVDIDIKVTENVAKVALMYNVQYHGFIADYWETGDPLVSLIRFCETGETLNYAGFSDEYVDAELAKIKQEMDTVVRDSLCKELAVYVLEQVPAVPIAPVPDAVYWWPWVKNYYGETYIQDRGFILIFWYSWIDQQLKTEMGY